tara:strand:- start:290 stop:3388 length:3099 start_codon:yes stop_codon:yes gene_type:complete
MIKLQLLDYKYDNTSNNQIKFNNITSKGSDWTIVNEYELSATSVAGTQYVSPVSGILTNGEQYIISLTLSNKTGGADIGFSTLGVDSSGANPTIGLTGAMRRSTDGSVTETFLAENSCALRIFAEGGTTGTVTARITQVGGINWNESVSGTLDVGNSQDFPVAINFSVADARNLNSRTGTYSKTFKIPATKNNNKILKSSYISGSYLSTNTISNQKACRIIVNDNLFIVGYLQITSIGKANEPKYYSCVFYGNNMDWASSLNNKLLMDLSVNSVEDGSGWDNLNRKGSGTGIGLEANRDKIMESWDADSATRKTNTSGTESANTNPITYPQVGYGATNVGGLSGSLQLLMTAADATAGAADKYGYHGFYNGDGGNNPDPYPTPTPQMNWRPAIFIYDIVKQIFLQEGYTLVSQFMEETSASGIKANFKKLVMLLPNFLHNNVSKRIADNSVYMSFDGNGYVAEKGFLATDPSDRAEIIWNSSTMEWNAGGNMSIIDDGSMYNTGNGFFTIQEYGFYDISASDIGGWLDSICEGTSATENLQNIYYVQIRVELQTVGQTSWNIIKRMDGFPETFYPYYETCPLPPNDDKSFNFEGFTLEDYWLNKGDKIRFRCTKKASWSSTDLNATPKTIGYDLSIWGGSSPTGYTSGSSSSSNGRISIIHKGERVEYGQTFDLKNVIDSSSTQMGFLKGIIHAFNLQMTTDTVSKIVTIEPFDDFYKNQNQAIDWTNKVDLSRIQDDKWVQSELSREIIFKYKTDSNDKVVEYRGDTYWDGIDDEYPYREFLSTEFKAGSTTFENPFFAGSYSSPDGESYYGSAFGDMASLTPYRANLWGLCDTGAIPTPGSSCRPPYAYNFMPRLLNYVKMSEFVTPPNPSRFQTRTQYWALADEFYLIPGYTGTYQYKFLCVASSYDKFTDSVNPRQPLTYNSLNQGTFVRSNNTVTSPIPFRGLYQTYYQKMIEQVKSNPRIKTVYVNLKLSDINNLDLRKLVYIDGYYYRINRVVDYMPNNNEVTKVELVLWEDLGFLPIDTSFNNN